MWSTQILGVEANAQHRMDDVLGVWKASGKGSARVHRSFSGWEIRKSRCGYYWQVFMPDGSPLDPDPRGRAPMWQSLHVAKWEADRAGAQIVSE